MANLLTNKVNTVLNSDAYDHIQIMSNCGTATNWRFNKVLVDFFSVKSLWSKKKTKNKKTKKQNKQRLCSHQTVTSGLQCKMIKG